MPYESSWIFAFPPLPLLSILMLAFRFFGYRVLYMYSMISSSHFYYICTGWSPCPGQKGTIFAFSSFCTATNTHETGITWISYITATCTYFWCSLMCPAWPAETKKKRPLFHLMSHPIGMNDVTNDYIMVCDVAFDVALFRSSQISLFLVQNYLKFSPKCSHIF
jgi:hypothetical protein